LLAQVDALAALALSLGEAPDRHAVLRDALLTQWVDSLQQHGSTLTPHRVRELLAMDAELNAQGLGVWLDRRQR
jgi:hypothetical protein